MEVWIANIFREEELQKQEFYLNLSEPILPNHNF